MLKHLPEKYLPDPERYLPTSKRLRKVEGSLTLAFGIVGLSLPAALLSGWIPIDRMASALSGQLPAVLALMAMACASLWWGYVLWRSKCYDQVWEEDERRWMWGWGVTVQLLMGIVFLSMAVEAFLRGLPS